MGQFQWTVIILAQLSGWAFHISRSNAVCVCPDVNQGGTNRSRCTQRLVVLRRPTNKPWPNNKNQVSLVYFRRQNPPPNTREIDICHIFKQAELHSQRAACWRKCPMSPTKQSTHKTCDPWPHDLWPGRMNVSRTYRLTTTSLQTLKLIREERKHLRFALSRKCVINHFPRPVAAQECSFGGHSPGILGNGSPLSSEVQRRSMHP